MKKKTQPLRGGRRGRASPTTGNVDRRRRKEMKAPAKHVWGHRPHREPRGQGGGNHAGPQRPGGDVGRNKRRGSRAPLAPTAHGGPCWVSRSDDRTPPTLSAPQRPWTEAPRHEATDLPSARLSAYGPRVSRQPAEAPWDSSLSNQVPWAKDGGPLRSVARGGRAHRGPKPGEVHVGHESNSDHQGRRTMARQTSDTSSSCPKTPVKPGSPNSRAG